MTRQSYFWAGGSGGNFIAPPRGFVPQQEGNGVGEGIGIVRQDDVLAVGNIESLAPMVVETVALPTAIPS